MPLTVSLPPIDPRPANPPEIRPAKVFPWLDDLLTRDPVEAAQVVGDSLAAINRVEMSDSKRLELAERYWSTAATLWPQLEKQFAKASHPLSGEALAATKAALGLGHELSVAYKRLLLHESGKRILLTGNRLLVALVHRCLQCVARVLVNSYLSYSPVPPKTWLDAHAIYAFSRERGLHQNAIAHDQPEMTPERVYLQALLLALANPYGFLPGQLSTVVRYLQEFCHWAKLTDVAPVHRMAKAVAIIPVGHDFPPFSANKGGSIDGSKIFLLTFDLAFQIQEQLRALEAGGEVPAGIPKDPAGRIQYVALLKRLLRQWAIPPARQFNRLPSRARVVMCAGLSGVWQYSRGVHTGVAQAPTGLPPMTACQVINHTPAGYALRQIDANPTALRIGDLIALRVEGRTGVQVAMVRWFRNTLKTSGLEFGCELLSDSPEAAAAASEDATDGNLAPVVVLPEDRNASGPDASPPQLLVPAGAFLLEQGISLKRSNDTGFAVLLKLVEQGPGFELYDFAPVG
jgi:cyclic-di-GMP-binding protein